MSDVREFAHKMARMLTAKSVEVGAIADKEPEPINRLELRGRACAFAEAAVMVLEAIPEGE